MDILAIFLGDVAFSALMMYLNYGAYNSKSSSAFLREWGKMLIQINSNQIVMVSLYLPVTRMNLLKPAITICGKLVTFSKLQYMRNFDANPITIGYLDYRVMKDLTMPKTV